MGADPIVFAAAFVALYAAHQVGDHWVQSSGQSRTKGRPGRAGRVACARHVAGLTATKGAFLALAVIVLGLGVHPVAVAAALLVDAVSHYWADRRSTLAALAARVGRTEFYRLGSTVTGADGAPAPHLGTGAYALDQSFHVAMLFVAALITAIGGGA